MQHAGATGRWAVGTGLNSFCISIVLAISAVLILSFTRTLVLFEVRFGEAWHTQCRVSGWREDVELVLDVWVMLFGVAVMQLI